MRDLLDSSVWLPLSAPDHVQYSRARWYWDKEADEQLAFCRVTALALLRHLTHPRIMGSAALYVPAAWTALEKWLATPRRAHLTFLEEGGGRRVERGQFVGEGRRLGVRKEVGTA